MGFEKDVSQIIEALNEKQKTTRQTALVSATLSAGELSNLNHVHIK